MLLAASENVKDVRLSTDSLDFAFTEKGRLSESKSLSVENKFGFPVMVNWTLLPIFDKNMGKQLKNPFSVHPTRQEIPANSTFTFNVDFGPYESDSYFFQIAQCFVQLLNGNHNKTKQLLASMDGSANGTLQKTMRSTTKTAKTLLGTAKKATYVDFSQEEIDPPQCLNVRFIGHSFAPGSQAFIPMIKTSTNKLTFTPCSPNESVYHTV